MILGSPKVMHLPVNLHKDLVQMPLSFRKAPHFPYPVLADFGGEQLPEPVRPKSHRLVAYIDPSFMKQIFDSAQRQWKAHIHHHDQADDLG